MILTLRNGNMQTLHQGEDYEQVIQKEEEIDGLCETYYQHGDHQRISYGRVVEFCCGGEGCNFCSGYDTSPFEEKKRKKETLALGESGSETTKNPNPNKIVIGIQII